MKLLTTVVLSAFAFMALFNSCQQDESLTSPRVTVNGKLNIRLDYPAKTAYDSAVIVFKNTTTEIKQNLMLNNASGVATGIMTIPNGDWKVSILYYAGLEDDMSTETIGIIDLQISETANELTSGKNMLYVKDESVLIKKALKWKDYYRYRLYLDNVLEGTVKLPKDPTDPIIEISTLHSRWSYAYADRLFFNGSADGSSYFYQAGSAFEVYDSVESIVNTTSFENAISAVASKKWNYADCIVIIYDEQDHELFLHHVWDFRSGKGRSGSRILFNKSEIDKRREIQLKFEGR